MVRVMRLNIVLTTAANTDGFAFEHTERDRASDDLVSPDADAFRMLRSASVCAHTGRARPLNISEILWVDAADPEFAGSAAVRAGCRRNIDRRAVLARATA